MIKITLVSCFLLTCITSVFSQNADNSTKIVVTDNSFNSNVAQENLSRQDFEKNINSYFNLSTNHSFEKANERTDDLDFTHISYIQKYKGISVEGFRTLLHLKNNFATTVNGQVAQFENLNIIPQLNENDAFEKAKNYTMAEALINQYPAELVIVKSSKEKVSEYKLAYKIRIDAFKPAVSMQNIYVDALNGDIINAISLISNSDAVGSAKTMYNGTKSITADSYSGVYRLRENTRKIQTYDATNASFNTGTGFTGYSDFIDCDNFWNSNYNIQSVTISYADPSWWYNSVTDTQADFYIVIKDCQSQVVYTSGYINNTNAPVTFNIGGYLTNPPYTIELWDYDGASGDDYGGAYSLNPTTTGTYNFNDGINTGNIVLNSSVNNPALDVHWGMEKTYDFYLNTFARNSFDGSGTTIKNFVNPPNSTDPSLPNNAMAFPTPYNFMIYGMGDGVNLGPLVELDIEGHEYSHMVINFNGNGGLTYAGESGALNESFADIMGIAIENYGKGFTDWKIGEDIVLIPPFFARSMSNPNSGPASLGSQQPDTYGGQYWFNVGGCTPGSTNDNCGVHLNSGVQNFWYYLLSQGGTGTNDIGYAYNVNGIGISDATKIAYRNLTLYLTPNATYNDSRLGSIQSAKDLFGVSSPKVQSVIDAWCAVGLGSCSTTGIKNVANEIYFSIFPNPNSGKFTIKISSQLTNSDLVTITDVLGRQVYQTKLTSQQQEVDLSEFGKGVYTVCVSSKNGRSVNRVVIE